MSKRRKYLELPSESVPIIDEADVIVAGGGTSGFIAAVASARTGAKTILIERFNYLGGCTTATYNTSIGHFFDSEGNQIIKGIPWEFIERMQKEGACVILPRHATSPQIWPPTTKKVALDMVLESGVNLYFYTWVTGVLKEDASVKGVIVQTKKGRGVILGKAFVDATGDADLSFFAGAPYEMTNPEELQQISIDLTACGVEPEKVREWAIANKEKLIGVSGLDVEYKKTSVTSMLTFTIPSEKTSFNGEWFYHTGIMPTVKLCIYREVVRIQGNADSLNPLDPKDLTKAEIKGFYGALEHLKYLKENIPGFENTYVIAQNHLGVRESRRIIGEYVLTIDNVRNQSRFEDVIALNCRALDYHLKGTLFKISHLKGNHDIPLRSLIPKEIKNLLVAGRCISCDHLAQASLRGAATCMATGHAAGVAAALVARENKDIRSVDIKTIQKTLIEQGAILTTER